MLIIKPPTNNVFYRYKKNHFPKFLYNVAILQETKIYETFDTKGTNAIQIGVILASDAIFKLLYKQKLIRD